MFPACYLDLVVELMEPGTASPLMLKAATTSARIVFDATATNAYNVVKSRPLLAAITYRRQYLQDMSISVGSRRFALLLLSISCLLFLTVAGAAAMGRSSVTRQALVAQEEQPGLPPGQRALLLVAELIFISVLLAAPARWLHGWYARTAQREQAKGIPWARIASVLSVAAACLGLATVFLLASYPAILGGGLPVGTTLPARQQALRHVPLVLGAALLGLLLALTMIWRRRLAHNAWRHHLVLVAGGALTLALMGV